MQSAFQHSDLCVYRSPLWEKGLGDEGNFFSVNQPPMQLGETVRYV